MNENIASQLPQYVKELLNIVSDSDNNTFVDRLVKWYKSKLLKTRNEEELADTFKVICACWNFVRIAGRLKGSFQDFLAIYYGDEPETIEMVERLTGWTIPISKT